MECCFGFKEVRPLTALPLQLHYKTTKGAYSSGTFKTGSTSKKTLPIGEYPF
ncbi:hypothetical protein VC82_834 [Flagellimonas lutaonensis]|uniref:Uncharacterized protein n=1 Tax=Flagellimonas lutaonensis TaxID=516051 RepID=A0A0D5YRI0_9FLAO|nr:hypothetical protein VC82_834 [Allomuricauda lutaonensis]